VLQEMPVALSPDRFDLVHGDRSAVDYYMSAAIKSAS